MTFLAACMTALWMGILSSIAPCPLTTNILAIAYLARQGGSQRAILLRCLAYAGGGMLAYAALGALAVWGLVNVPVVSQFLQRYRFGFLGLVLIVVGLVLTGLVRPPFRLAFGKTAAIPQAGEARGGLLGALFMGILFAISFCPTTAAMFFQVLLTAAVQSRQPLLLPVLYGLGAAMPVIVLATLLAGGTQLAGKIFGSLQKIEKWTRLATGVLFIGAGAVFIAVQMWLSLRSIQ